MKDGLRPYPEYKSVDIPWLDKVPAHWEMQRMKHLFVQRNIRGFPHEPMLAATQTKGVVRKDEYENRTVLALKDLHLLKLVEIGDFVISLRSFQGGIEYARHRGIISPAYTILYQNDDLDHGYYASLFKSRPFIGGLRLYVTGIRQGQNIDYTRLSRSYLPLPSLIEQKAISAYVKSINHRCARFIRNRRRLIEVLNEQKQAIINRAVTRGLDSDVLVKSSGIDWIGDIPAHWKVCRLRNVLSSVTSGSRGWGSYASDSGPLFIRIANLRRLSLDLRFDNIVRLNLPVTSEARRTRLRPGDILVSITAYIGSIAVVPQRFEEAYVSQHVARCPLRDKKHNPRWLGYVLLSRVGQTHGNISLYGGTKDGLSFNDVKNYPMLLPPRDEQDRIVDFLEHSLGEIDCAIQRTRREIELIREYRTRLISDVVTGKVDVRHLAPAPGREDLEDMVEELEPLDEATGELDEDAFAGQVDV